MYTGRSRYRRRRSSGNYRMRLLLALVVSLILMVVFLALFLSHRGKAKELEEQVTTLTGQVTALTAEKTQLQQTLEGLYTSAIDALAEPTTAQTESLPDLIPQLTEGIYLVRGTGSGYQYLRIPSGILADRLTAYRDSPDYAQTAAGAATDWNVWVLYSDKVIGMRLNADDHGFVSNERTATGTEYDLPDGFNAFVSSLFA